MNPPSTTPLALATPPLRLAACECLAPVAGPTWGAARRPVIITSSNYGVGSLHAFRRDTLASRPPTPPPKKFPTPHGSIFSTHEKISPAPSLPAGV